MNLNKIQADSTQKIGIKSGANDVPIIGGFSVKSKTTRAGT
jgi:hypothetical protein